MIVEAVEFVRHAVGGFVHVLDHYLVEDAEEGSTRQVALCGRTGRPDVYSNVATFDDSELCPRCWRLTAPEQRRALFTHPQETKGPA